MTKSRRATTLNNGTSMVEQDFQGLINSLHDAASFSVVKQLQCLVDAAFLWWKVAVVRLTSVMELGNWRIGSFM